MTAYDYPILGLFWTMLIFFLWVAWIMILFKTIFDIFRSDIGGLAKAFWAIFVVIIPWLGVLVYLIVHGKDMASRDIAKQQQQQEEFASYVRQTAGSDTGTADELAKLADLRDRGVITETEFANQKAKLFA